MTLPEADLNPGADAPLKPARRISRASPWWRAMDRLRADRWAMAGLAIVTLFFIIALGVWLGWWGGDWMATGGGQWRGPSSEYWLGTTILGQDIFSRAIFSTRTAFEIGLIVAVASMDSPPVTYSEWSSAFSVTRMSWSPADRSRSRWYHSP